VALAVLFTAGCAETGPTETALSSADAHFAHAAMGPTGAEVGTTAGWFRGEVVTFLYNQDFQRPLPLADGTEAGSDSNCVLGAEAARPPRGGNDPVAYVTVPLFEDTEGITLHCPVAGDCINHPSTIDLSRVFGPDTKNAALPAHSHVIDVKRGGWWVVEVNGVFTREAWDAIEREKSLAEIRRQQAMETVTPDLDTNLFLFFNVMNKNERRGGPFITN
jgi:hypothetical protein